MNDLCDLFFSFSPELSCFKIGEKFSIHAVISVHKDGRPSCPWLQNRGEIFFTRNGKFLGVAFRSVNGRLVPTFSLRSEGDEIRINFGQEPFMVSVGPVPRPSRRALRKSGEVATRSLILLC